MNPPPAISVILPAYRAAATLAEAVASVQAQSRTDWELIIVNDASSDETGEVAERLAAADPRIRIFHLTQNAGAAVARNTAIRAALGRYIAFLDADDLWLPQKLERQIAFMTLKGAALSHTAVLRRKAGRERRVKVPDRVTRNQLLHGNVISCSTAIYDTALVGKVEMPLIRLRQDFGLWLRILAVTPVAHGLNEVLAVHRHRENSLSAGLVKRIRGTWRLYRSVEGLGRLQAARCLMAHLLNRARALLWPFP